MISYISWKIIDLDTMVVDILTSSWVWYEVNINELVYSNINNKKDIELYIYHHIVEWGQSLFWFISIEEKKTFKELIKISWVWGKVAMSILSMWNTRLADAIVNEDKKSIQEIKWIWKKMAEKIILELKDKDFIKLNFVKKSEKKDEKIVSIDIDLKTNILTTLSNMWYNSRLVEEELSKLPEWLETVEVIIPYIIKKL